MVVESSVLLSFYSAKYGTNSGAIPVLDNVVTMVLPVYKPRLFNLSLLIVIINMYYMYGI